MTLNSEERKIAINLLVEKSENNFQQALAVAALGYWDMVANRLYYSVFHLINALLLADKVVARSHNGTSAMFGKHYVMTGIFSREDGILYSRLQSMREKADYNNVFVMTPEEGETLINEVTILRGKIQTAIKRGYEL